MEMGIKEYSGDYKTSGEYAEALRSWINQMYQIHCASASFPYFVALLQTQQSNAANQASNQTTGNTTQAQTPNPDNSNTNNQEPPPRRGVEYKIPALRKRFLAEIIDFLILFAVKFIITYIIADAFDFFEDMENFDLENLRVDFLNDYRLALNVTSEILVLELVHRVGTCLFEALCLQRGGRGTVGGATPGKQLLGLRVVRCEWMAPTANDRALVYPATDLGIYRALARSVVKNFSLTFLFPIYFTLFTFQHNRTMYDLFAGSVVVEITNNN